MGNTEWNVIDAFGPRAAGLRKLQGLSQDRVADRMRDLGHDWHQTTVSKVEGGQRALSYREAYDLAKVLDRHLRDFLVGWAGEADESSDHERTLEEHRIAEARLDEARRGLEDAQARVAAAEERLRAVIAQAPEVGRKAPRRRKGE